MDCLKVYLLTRLSLDAKGNVRNHNIGVTFSLHEAERHKGKGVDNDFETFQTDANWLEQAATTDLVVAMRGFCDMVREMQEAALR
jgi:hydroxyethylthiazole kinase-like sugar kinase family protein